MAIFLTVGFIFSVAWLGVSFFLLFSGKLEQLVLGVLIGLSTVVYSLYMGYTAYRLYADSKVEYQLELNDSEAVLYIIDPVRKRKSTQMVVLADVKYAEYYPYKDSATVFLYAPYMVMEIPLWPLGSYGTDVIDFLSGFGIPIMNVQSDDKLPVS